VEAVEAAALALRLDGLRRFLRATGRYLPRARLAPARELVEWAATRSRLPPGHTVVALAGATGGGKSSLFNALAGRQLSPVDVRRPTTGQAYACVWDSLDGARELLDRLDVSPAHRYARQPVGPDDERLRGLVLLDLPDSDSIELEHSAEVERLLGLVDAVVWVLDPQKYANRVVHGRHLLQFRRHREVTVIALNQADLLSAGDLDLLLGDLRQLLTADGLDDFLTIATSAVDAPAGLSQLRARLEEIVGSRCAPVRRLAGDVDLMTEDLAELVGPPVTPLDPATVRELNEAMAREAGAVTVVDELAASYRRRAVATGWPLVDLFRRLRSDPLRGLPPYGEVAAAAVPDPARPSAPVRRALPDQVVRPVATRAAVGLPEPWPEAVAVAARSRLDGLPDALAAATAVEDVPVPGWWRAGGSVQWLAVAAVLVGLGWYGAAALTATAPSPVATLLLWGGPVAAALQAAGWWLLVRWTAGRTRARMVGRLRVSISAVGREQLLAPVAEVLDGYSEARESLRAARGAR
jgi:hypothetical protein